VFPNAPAGLVFPGDPGVPDGIAQGANAFHGRVWVSRGTRPVPASGPVRASYGLFYDQFENGAGTASQVPVSSIPWAQFNQYSGAGLNFQNPYLGRVYPPADSFVRPSTVFTIDTNAKPPYAQDWNVSVERSLLGKYLVEVRYVGARAVAFREISKTTRRSTAPAPRHRTPTSAATTRTARLQAARATSRRSPMLSYITRSMYNAGQVSLSRRYAAGVGSMSPTGSPTRKTSCHP